jgi:hypothetical protein
MVNIWWKNNEIRWRHEPERIGITFRDHDQKLRSQIIHHSLPNHNFFTNRVVEECIQLDKNVLNEKSENKFKNKLKLNEKRLFKSNINCF